jgi:FAD/FMN-containing dehydrogenase
MSRFRGPMHHEILAAQTRMIAWAEFKTVPMPPSTACWTTKRPALDPAADDFGRALRANGYKVDHANTRHIQHALYAKTLGMEVVLTFFPHDEQTRVEILFLGGAAS